MLDWVGDGHCGANVTIRLLNDGPHIFDFQFFASRSSSKRSDWKLVPADGNARVRVVSDAFENVYVLSVTVRDQVAEARRKRSP